MRYVRFKQHPFQFFEQVIEGLTRLDDASSLGHDTPAEVHIGEAMDVIARRLDQPYDLVFLDAQKSHYADQCSLLRARGLMGSGTLLLADNVVDRAAECATFFAWLEGAGLSFEIRPTECGLLVTTL